MTFRYNPRPDPENPQTPEELRRRADERAELSEKIKQQIILLTRTAGEKEMAEQIADLRRRIDAIEAKLV